jgi:hypothetical protein
MKYKLAPAGAYMALMAAFIFEAFDFPGTYPDWVVLAVLLGSQLALGLAVGRWWALLFPAVVVLVLIPASWPNDAEVPASFGMAVAAVFSFPLVALGVIVRRRPDYRRWVRSRSLGARADRLSSQ